MPHVRGIKRSLTSKYARGAVIAGVTLLAALGAACSDSEDEDTAAPASTAKATSTAVAKATGTATGTGTAKAAEPNAFTITGSEYAFAVTGNAVPGSDLVTFKNGGKELHHLQLVQLQSGKTLADVMTVLSNPQADLSQIPGKFVGGVGQLVPNGSGVLQAKLAAGNYAMLCFLEAEDGAPHFTKGMSGSFEVKGTENTAAFAGTPTKVTGTDYAFAAPDSVKAGKLVLELANGGKEPHEANLVKLNDGVTVQQALAAVQAGGPPPITPMGGAQAIIPGDTTRVEVNVEKGTYALVCFVPDASGTPHAFLGMARELKVE